MKDLANVKEVGFDCEFVPQSDNLALLQLAAENNIYVIDGLTNQISADRWDSFGEQILNNAAVLKIGKLIEDSEWNVFGLFANALPFLISMSKSITI